MICYLDSCIERLSVASGTLVLHDPATLSGVEISLTQPATAEIVYLLTDHDIAGVELTLLPTAQCDWYCRVGSVGVDSAKIVIGDRSAIDSCPPTALFLSTQEENAPVIKTVVSHFRLDTRQLIDETAEVVTNDPARMYCAIADYISSELRLNADHYVAYYSEDGYWQRCCEAACDGGFFQVGSEKLFLFNTGSDGSFNVIAGYSDGMVAKIWLLIDDRLFVDERIMYTPRPLETRPPPKPPSAKFVEMMTRMLEELPQKKSRWKFW